MAEFTHHHVDQAEITAFTEHINFYMADDKDL